MDKAALRRGEQQIRRMLGAEYGSQMRRAWRTLEPEFERYVVGFLAGEIWRRPRLPLKVRSLVTVAALAALGRTEALALNVRMAVNNGASPGEVRETLLQLAPYAGFPACWGGLVVADRVFQEMESARSAARSNAALTAFCTAAVRTANA